MPKVTCPGCGERTFAITGWADLDHCANCGRPLATSDINPAGPNRGRAELERHLRSSSSPRAAAPPKEETTPR